MKTKYLSAYTPAVVPYPPYVNISREDDEVVVSVRAPARDRDIDGQVVPDAGATSVIRLPVDEAVKLFEQALKNLS